jgi:hypothetical protein
MTLLHLLLLHVSSVILGAGPDLSYLSEIWGPPHFTGLWKDFARMVRRIVSDPLTDPTIDAFPA